MVSTEACKGYSTCSSKFTQIYSSKFTELSTNDAKDHSFNILGKEMIIMQEKKCHQYVWLVVVHWGFVQVWGRGKKSKIVAHE